MSYPTDLQIRVLYPDEWAMVKETYEREFENAMPDNPAQSVFFGVFLSQDLVGFVHVELVFNLNAFWLEPEHRNRSIAKAMFDTLEDKLPREFPVIALPDKNLSKLLEKHNFRNLGEILFFRRDN